MATTYEPIATYSATGSVATYSFTSISSAYTDIVAVISGNTTNANMCMRFNGDSTSTYSRTVLRGNGTSATSFLQSSQTELVLDGSYSTPGQNFIVNVMNYSNATSYKTVLSRSNNAGLGLDQEVGLWRNTAAINRIDFLFSGAGNFTAGTTFNLYGIKAA